MPDPDPLRGDHEEIDRILERIFAALDGRESVFAFENLDNFWARLAVHIRAEHLCLFPELLKIVPDHECVDESVEGENSLEELIEGLRNDHNFFMSELGSLIKEWRATVTAHEEGEHSLSSETRIRLDRLRRRLLLHNEIEENQVYPLIDSALSPVDAGDLRARIEKELNRMPARFGEN